MKHCIAIVIGLVFLISFRERAYVSSDCGFKEFQYIQKTPRADTFRFYGVTDIKQAINCARREQKQILLIFSGMSAMPISNLEWRTLSLFGDNEFLQSKYILTWLAVDDRSMISAGRLDKRLFEGIDNAKTVGEQNMLLQRHLTQSVIQPAYCIIDTNLNRHGLIMNYTDDESVVKEFVMCGLNK